MWSRLCSQDLWKDSHNLESIVLVRKVLRFIPTVILWVSIFRVMFRYVACKISLRITSQRGQGISVPLWILDMPLHTQCHLNRGRDLVIWVHGSVCVWFLCCFRLLYILRHLSLMMAGDEGESGEFGRRDDMEVNKGLRADVGWWSGVYSPCRVFH